MGRVYAEITAEGKSLHTLFDPGAVHNYIIRKKKEGFLPYTLKKSFEIAIGGERENIISACLIDGEIQGNHLFYWAFVIDDLGLDEKGREIELLLGATEMQRWNIKIDLQEEKLDLSRFRKEFIEY